MLESRLSKNILPAWVILGVGLLATVFASLQVKQSIEQDAVRQFALACDQVTLKIQERLDAYALILRGGAALFAASIAVDRHKWQAYVETLRAEGSVPGVQGIGFAQAIPANELAAHIAHIRGEGFPEYTVRPSGERAIYTSIIYLEPFRDRNLRAFGYDMFSEPVRRVAMERARDTGEAALSGKVELVQETGTEVQAGTLMYVPVYRNGMPIDTLGQRRAALIGWIYSPHRMDDLMIGIFSDWISHEGKTIEMQIYDGSQATPAALLFDRKVVHVANLHSLFYQQRTISFNGHQWLLVFDHTSTSAGISYVDAWATLVGGLALSGFLFWLLISMRAGDARDIATHELAVRRQIEMQLASIVESSNDAIIGKTTDGIITSWNKSAENIYGYSADEIIGKHITVIVPPSRHAEICEFMEKISKGGTIVNHESERIRKDGSLIHVALTLSPIRDTSGNITGISTIARDITERKQAEEALRSLTLLQRAILDNVAYGVISTNPDGIVTSFNPAAERLLGYAANEVVGLQTPACWHDPEEIARNALQLSEELGTPIAAGFEVFAARPRRNLPEEHEWTFIRKDGRRIPVNLSVTALRNEGGQITGFVGMTHDLTERKRTEQALELNSQRMQALLQLNQMMGATLKEITDFTLEAAVRLTQSKIGYLAFLNEDESVLTMHSWSKSAMAECAINEKPIIYPVVSTGLWGEAVRQRQPIITNDYSAANPLKKGYPEGHVHIKRHMNVPVFDEDRIVIVAGVGNKDEEYNQGDVQQLTLLMEGMWRLMERKRVEEEIHKLNTKLEQRVKNRTRELAASEERMRLFFERQLVGMAITSPEKGWIKVNDKICEMMGYSHEELARMSWAEMTYPEDLAPDELQFKRLLDGEIDSYTLEKRFVRKDGSIVFTNLSVGCVRRADQSVDYVLALLEDITERKGAEESVKKLNEELLQRAKALEGANKELESFSYSVSHDLRTPLRAIDGFSHILLEDYADKLDDEGKRLLNIVRDNTSRMGQLIDDILKFSRTGRLELTFAEIDMEKLAHEVFEELQPSDTGSKLQLEIEPIPPATGDRTMMRQVFVNLLSNAIKFSRPRETARIKVGGSIEGNEAIYYVKDNGVGFDMQYVDKLFGVFQRLHSVDEFEGTGIGLAIVKRIITRHDGRVWAEGKVNKGATIYFALPIRRNNHE